MIDLDTKNAIEKLRLGHADQRDRDRVLCYLADSRWTPEHLDKHIEERHTALCKDCPVRRGDGKLSKIERALFLAVLALIGVLVAVTKAHIPGL